MKLKKIVFITAILCVLLGLFLIYKAPFGVYDYLLNSFSYALKYYFNTNGSIEKINWGLNKIGITLLIIGISVPIFSKIWQKLTYNFKSNYIAKELLPQYEKLKFYDYLIIIILFLIGAILRYFPIHQSLWGDEYSTYITFIKPGLVATLLPVSACGPHPFLQIIVRIFITFFGNNDLNLRLPVYIIAIITIPLFYFVIFRFTGNRLTAFIACMLLTFHSFHIYYSFQMRGYAILIFFSVLSIYYFIKYMGSTNRKNSCILLIVNLLLVYTNIYGLLLVISEFSFVLVFLLLIKINKQIELPFKNKFVVEYTKHFAITALGIFILYLTHFPVIAMSLFDPHSLKAMNFSHYIQSVISLSCEISSLSDQKIVCYILVLVPITGIFLMYKNKLYSIIWTIFVLILIFTMILKSNQGFYSRYFSCVIPLYLILISILISNLVLNNNIKLKITGILLFFSYLIFSIHGISQAYIPIQPFKEAIQFIKQYKKSEYVLLIPQLSETSLFYDENGIVIKKKKALMPIIQNYKKIKNKEIYFITTNSSKTINKNLYPEVYEIHLLIEKHFENIHTENGKHPIGVWKLIQ